MCETGWEGETCGAFRFSRLSPRDETNELTRRGSADTCSKGFFGPTCQPCPAGCASCDDGLTGSGLCLSPSSSSSIVLPSASSTAPTRSRIAHETDAPTKQAHVTASTASARQTRPRRRASAAPGGRPPRTGRSVRRAPRVTTSAPRGIASVRFSFPAAPGFSATDQGNRCTIDRKTACDPTCASCSSPTGTCLTCQPSLQPTSSSPTTCIASSSALQNGTFVTCPSRTYWDSTTQQCRACDPMCDECFGAGVERCSSCREPNVLMPAGKGCVAVDSKTGVCDASSGVAAGNGTASRWVFDNAKGVCDGSSPLPSALPNFPSDDSAASPLSDDTALPAKCVAGGINSFSSTSTRAQLVCSKCLPGSFLVNGACVDECPAGTMASSDGTSCQGAPRSCVRSRDWRLTSECAHRCSLRLVVRDVRQLAFVLHLVRLVLGARPQRHLHLGPVLPSRLLLLPVLLLAPRPLPLLLQPHRPNLSPVPSRLRHLHRIAHDLPDLPRLATRLPRRLVLLRPNLPEPNRLLRLERSPVRRVRRLVRRVCGRGTGRVYELQGGVGDEARSGEVRGAERWVSSDGRVGRLPRGSRHGRGGGAG